MTRTHKILATCCIVLALAATPVAADNTIQPLHSVDVVHPPGLPVSPPAPGCEAPMDCAVQQPPDAPPAPPPDTELHPHPALRGASTSVELNPGEVEIPTPRSPQSSAAPVSAPTPR